MTAQQNPDTGGGPRTIISVDAMGGDHGPAAIVAGLAVCAAANPNIGFILHGPEPELTGLITRRRALQGRC